MICSATNKEFSATTVIFADLLKIITCDILIYNRGDAILILGKKLLLESAERKTTYMLPCTRVLSVPSFLKERGMMSRQQRLIYLPLVGTILLCLLVCVFLAAWKRFSKPDPSITIIKHSVDTPSDDALKYWTADKMRNAKAAPLPNVNTLDRGKKHPRRPPHASSPHDA